jgi:hypothetical protein
MTDKKELLQRCRESLAWIPVSERLPEEGQVLIVFKEPFFGRQTDEISTGYFDVESGKWRFWQPDKEVEGLGVTHWMPLPLPPVEENGE